MAGKADVQTHLNNRREAIEILFADWASQDLAAEDRAGILETYFKEADLGETRRLGAGNTVYAASPSADDKRANVLVVGRHDTADLASVPGSAAAQGGAGPPGPGLASRLGPTIAFAEGVQAARTVTVDSPINVSFLSVGANDTIADAVATLFTGNLDAIYVTNSMQWNPAHPTIVTGARGQLVAELALTAGAPISDFEVSGALRNPLTKLTQLLGDFRDHRGRIALPGFYERAHAPDAGMRAALGADGLDANAWAEDLQIAAPSASLSRLERASLWPGVSVLAINADVNDGVRAPDKVSATVAIYLIPDQRHAEVERSLREWFMNRAPADLHPTIRITSSTRPYRAAPDSIAVAAQARAAFRLFGRHPVLVPAGGPAGAGEMSFAVGAPLGFAGIAAPSTSLGTTAEQLVWSDFETGVAMAAETCLQLRRT